MRMLLLLWLLSSACSDRYTPWEIDVPPEFNELTGRQLERLRDLPSSSLPFTVALIGDPQGTPLDLERVVDAINARREVTFTLVLGDLTDYGLMHEYVWAAKALERLHRPYLTVVGNRDAISHGKAIYQNMFGAFDYTFDYSGFKFVMWNNNQFEFGTTDFNWIRSQLDEKTFIASHVPPTVDMHSSEQVDEWKRISRDAGIMASLHGHRGGKTDFYWTEDQIPYYVVPKVEGVRYSLMTIDKNRQVSFQLCRSSCELEQ
jgi:Icc protein